MVISPGLCLLSFNICTWNEAPSFPGRSAVTVLLNFSFLSPDVFEQSDEQQDLRLADPSRNSLRVGRSHHAFRRLLADPSDPAAAGMRGNENVLTSKDLFHIRRIRSHPPEPWKSSGNDCWRSVRNPRSFARCVGIPLMEVRETFSIFSVKGPSRTMKNHISLESQKKVNWVAIRRVNTPCFSSSARATAFIRTSPLGSER